MAETEGEPGPDDGVPPGGETAGGVDPAADVIRLSANAAQVHAAAITAAKDLLLSRPDLAGVPSDQAAAYIGMHAAVIFRTYLEIVGNDGLVPDIARQ